MVSGRRKMGALQGCLSRGGRDMANGTVVVADSNGAGGGGAFTMDYGLAPQQTSTADRNAKDELKEPPELEAPSSVQVLEELQISRETQEVSAPEIVTRNSYLSPVKVHPRASTSYLDVPEVDYVQPEEPEEEDTFAEYTDTFEEEEMAAPQVKLQKPAPFFKGTAVVNGEFKEISLDDYKGKYVVLFFYPLDFTFVCPTEIIAFSDRAEDFRSIGCEVIAASTDSHFSHLAWVNTPRKSGGLGKMEIPMLADKNGEIAKKYGIYKDDEGIAFRGLFIIDEEQRLRQITVNDLPVGRSVDETFRLVQAFQFTDKHGEVCPAGWKPGSKTIKPNVEDSKNYFKNSE